jgi:hypothetical protein
MSLQLKHPQIKYITLDIEYNATVPEGICITVLQVIKLIEK